MSDRIVWKNETRKIADLLPAEYNPRQLTEKQAKDLDTSLTRFNLADPIIINADNKIIGGHQRINILKQRGAVEVDVRVPSRQLTEHEEKELNLRLNKNLGEWDFDLLAGFDKEMLLDVGFDSAELDKMFQLEPDAQDDEVPEAPVEPISKTGDIWLLGRHRVMCGDSTKIEDVEKLMDGKKADMVFTDPPYGMNLDTGMSNITNPKDKLINKKKNYDTVIGDNADYDPSHLFEMFPDVKEMFLWGADYYAERIKDKNNGSFFVWDKRAGLEEVEYSLSSFELCWSKQKHRRDIIRVKWFGLAGTETQDIRNRVHPTQKPIEVCSWFIDKFSKVDEIIIDLFLGSGSTLIACEQTNRICYGMEIDPKYVDVIRKRYAKFIGKEEEWEKLTKKVM